MPVAYVVALTVYVPFDFAQDRRARSGEAVRSMAREESRALSFRRYLELMTVLEEQASGIKQLHSHKLFHRRNAHAFQPRELPCCPQLARATGRDHSVCASRLPPDQRAGSGPPPGARPRGAVRRQGHRRPSQDLEGMRQINRMSLRSHHSRRFTGCPLHHQKRNGECGPYTADCGA